MQNSVHLIGRLAKEPELKQYDNGKRKTEITIAVQRPFKNADGVYEADFLKCKVWNGIAENVCEYIKVGDLIGVKGRIEHNNNSNEIVVERVSFLCSKKEKEDKNLEQDTNELDIEEEI